MAEGQSALVVAAAQIGTGYDIDSNASKIKSMLDQAHDRGCQVVVFHEGCLAGYPQEQHLPSFDFERPSWRILRRCAHLRRERHCPRAVRKDVAGRRAVVCRRLRPGHLSSLLGGCDRPRLSRFALSGADPPACRRGSPHRFHRQQRAFAQSGGQAAGIPLHADLPGNGELRLRGHGQSAGRRGRFRQKEKKNSSHGNSKVVDPLGNVLDEAGWFEERLVSARIDLSQATGDTVLRTMGRSPTEERRYGVAEEHPGYAEWMRAGLSLVRRLGQPERGIRR